MFAWSERMLKPNFGYFAYALRNVISLAAPNLTPSKCSFQKNLEYLKESWHEHFGS